MAGPLVPSFLGVISFCIVEVLLWSMRTQIILFKGSMFEMDMSPITRVMQKIEDPDRAPIGEWTNQEIAAAVWIV